MRTVKPAKRPDYVVIFCIAFLTIFGLVMLASASSHLGKIKFDDSYYYLKHQLLFGFLLGVAGFIFGYKAYYRYLEKFSVFLLLFSIVTLILVFTPLGLSAGGADRWLNFGPVSFQPSELLKITFMVYLAAWLGGNSERAKNFWQGFMPFLAVAGTIGFLLIKQPATSTVAILMASALIVYFVSGARLVYIFGSMIVGALVLALIVYLTPYRFSRVLNFINPEANPQAGGYHINQAKIAIGSGGLFGVGYGQSTTKIKYLPEPIGDSIFAVIGEELGFAGATVLLLAFVLLVGRTLFLARRAPDKFAKLLLVGFATIIAIQTFVNIGAISGLLPLTGTPLPFISYGGTALAVFMTMGGMIANISRHI